MLLRTESRRLGVRLPIALFVCALMVLPAASFLSTSDATHGGGSAAPATAAVASAPSASSTNSTHYRHGYAAGPGNTTARSLAVPAPAAPTGLSSSFASDLATGVGSGQPAVGRNLGDLVSYPSASILNNLAPDVTAVSTVTPNYVSTPAPLGLADYGVGASGPYNYSTPSFRATVGLEAAPNVTAPVTQSVIDPSGAKLGLVASPYEFSLQLNTVLTNVTIPGTNFGAFWTQNVIDVNATAIHFVDDVWNISAYSDGYFPIGGYPATIASGCGTTNVTGILNLSQGVYQCVGGSVAISSASYPLTIQLFNNASVTAAGDDQVQFGYRITGAGGLAATGVSDTVVFNNPNGTFVPPPNPVAFEVNGSSYAPTYPFLYDSEIVFGGPIGGSNAVFRSLNGTLQLQYSHAGAYKNIRSAYDFGSDTGETAVGLSAYYTTDGVEEVNQGPSLLYGLWNGTASNSVSSGFIRFAGSIDPTYGFVFVSNVASPGTYGTNLSWVPTTATGTFDSLLPPAIPTGGAAYTTMLYAPNQTVVSGTAFSTSQTDYAFPASTHFDETDAPLYMDGETQAKDLAVNVTGYTSGAYDFNSLVINMPFPFTHLNDFGYPSFVILQAEGLKSTAVHVNDTIEGDNFDGALYFIYDTGSSGWQFEQPAPYGFQDGYTEQFNIWGSASPQVTNETLIGRGAFSGAFQDGPGAIGGGVFLYGDSGAVAYNLSSEAGSWGLANVASHGTSVHALAAYTGAIALSDIGSSKTVGLNISANGPEDSIGVYELGSTSPSYTYLNATGRAYALLAGLDEYLRSGYRGAFGVKDASVKYVNATDDAYGAIFIWSSDNTVSDIGAYYGAGVAAAFSSGTTIENVRAFAATAFVTVGSNYTNVSDVDSRYGCDVICLDDAASVVDGSNYSVVTDASYYEVGEYEGSGLLVAGSNHTTVTDPSLQLGSTDYYTGVALFDDNYTTITDASARLNYSDVYGEGEIESAAIYGEHVNYTNVTGSTIQETAALQYPFFCDECELEDLHVYLTGIALEEANWSSVVSSTFTLAGRLANSTDFDSVILEVDGLYLQDTNASSVTGTTVAANATAFDINDLYDSAEYVTGIDLFGTYNTTIATTTVSEAFYAYEVYDFDDSSVEVYAAYATYGTLTTFSGTTITNSYLLAYTTYETGGVELELWGLDLYGEYRTTVSTLTYTGLPYERLTAFYLKYGTYLNVTGLSVTDAAVGAYLEYVSWANFRSITASHYSIGVYLYDDYDVDVSQVSLTWLSAGVLATDYTEGVNVNDVTATNVTTQSPWAYPFYGLWDAPAAVVVTFMASYVNVTNVVAVNYPAILYTGAGYECGAQQVTATNLTADGGYALALLNDSSYALLTNLTATNVQIGVSLYDSSYISLTDVNVTGAATYGLWAWALYDSYVYASNFSADWQGLALIDDCEYDQIWDSTFYHDTSYGVWVFGSFDIVVWGNDFVGDNGATSVYSPAHIQAYAGYSDSYYFYNDGTGNYWADWHTFSYPGVLAPYYVGDGNYDEYPLAAPAGQAAVVFDENGLATGTTWSVTFDGTTETTSGNVLTFGAPAGTTAIDYTVGAVAGYVATPTSGSVTPDVMTTSVAISFEATATVTLTETGLSSGTNWSATVGGITESSKTTSMTFTLPVGNYTYDIVPVSGYSSSLTHGNLTLTTHGYSFLVAYTGSSASSFAKTFDPLVGIAIGLAALAVILALVAVLVLTRRPKTPTPSPATPWQEPPAGPSTGASGGPGH